MSKGSAGTGINLNMQQLQGGSWGTPSMAAGSQVTTRAAVGAQYRGGMPAPPGEHLDDHGDRSRKGSSMHIKPQNHAGSSMASYAPLTSPRGPGRGDRAGPFASNATSTSYTRAPGYHGHGAGSSNGRPGHHDSPQGGNPWPYGADSLGAVPVTVTEDASLWRSTNNIHGPSHADGPPAGMRAPPPAGMRGALSWGVGPNAYEVDGRPGTRGGGTVYDLEGRPLTRNGGRPASRMQLGLSGVSQQLPARTPSDMFPPPPPVASASSGHLSISAPNTISTSLSSPSFRRGGPGSLTSPTGGIRPGNAACGALEQVLPMRPQLAPLSRGKGSVSPGPRSGHGPPGVKRIDEQPEGALDVDALVEQLSDDGEGSAASGNDGASLNDLHNFLSSMDQDDLTASMKQKNQGRTGGASGGGARGGLPSPQQRLGPKHRQASQQLRSSDTVSRSPPSAAAAEHGEGADAAASAPRSSGHRRTSGKPVPPQFEHLNAKAVRMALKLVDAMVAQAVRTAEVNAIIKEAEEKEAAQEQERVVLDSANWQDAIRANVSAPDEFGGLMTSVGTKLASKDAAVAAAQRRQQQLEQDRNALPLPVDDFKHLSALQQQAASRTGSRGGGSAGGGWSTNQHEPLSPGKTTAPALLTTGMARYAIRSIPS